MYTDAFSFVENIIGVNYVIQRFIGFNRSFRIGMTVAVKLQK